jgi:hypothetical protein
MAVPEKDLGAEQTLDRHSGSREAAIRNPFAEKQKEWIPGSLLCSAPE